MDPFSQFMSQNRSAYAAANPPPAPPPAPAQPRGSGGVIIPIPPEPGAGTYGRVNPGGGVTIGSGAGVMQQPFQGGMNPFVQLLQKLLGMGQFGGQQPQMVQPPAGGLFQGGTFGSVNPGGQVSIGSGQAPFSQPAQQPGGAGGGMYGGGGSNPMLGLLQALLGRGMNVATAQVPQGGGQPVIRY